MADGYQADYSGIGDMLTASFMVAEMRRRAEKMKVFAEGIAPVDEDGPHPGRYKASFHVESGVQRRKTRRAFGRLYNDSPEAIWVEFVPRKLGPPHRVLGRSLDAARD
jgi:hypothetical protein